jgi:hypothetical protein
MNMHVTYMFMFAQALLPHLRTDCYVMYSNYSTVCLVSCPDPPSRREKGLVNLDTILGPGKAIWALQWDCSFSVVMWLANRRNAKRHCQLYKFESSAHARSRPWPIRSKVCFSTAVSARAHRAGQTKECVRINQTLSLLEGGVWARDYCLSRSVKFLMVNTSLALSLSVLGLTIVVYRAPGASLL